MLVPVLVLVLTGIVGVAERTITKLNRFFPSNIKADPKESPPPNHSVALAFAGGLPPTVKRFDMETHLGGTFSPPQKNGFFNEKRSFLVDFH